MPPGTPTPIAAQGAQATLTPRAAVPDAYFIMAIESSAQANTWYRIRRRRDGDAADNALMCDCPAWVFARRRDRPVRTLPANGPDEARACKHTRVAQALLSIRRPQPSAGAPTAFPQPTHSAAPSTLAWAPTPTPATHVARIGGATPTPPNTPNAPTTLADADRTQAVRDAIGARWPALGELHGVWEVEERDGVIGGAPYCFTVVRLTTGGGALATGALAQARRHHPTAADLLPGIAQWVGYALAVGVALAARLPVTQADEPEHFSVDWQPRANRPQPPNTPYAPPQQPGARRDDVLRAGDALDLGDGLEPAERAENTLRLVIGDDLYRQLETQHYLDVASVTFAGEERVYRVRRDPAKLRDRRVRVFEHGRYIHDFCIVRAQSCPEADQWLTVFLRLLADEQGALSVVKRPNVFPPNSDDPERETVPAIWRAR